MNKNISIPLLDLKAQFATIKDEIMTAVSQIFEEQSFILGSQVAKTEKMLASFLGVKHAIGVSSGTDALLLSLMSLGIGPGDGVITTPFTFFSTVSSIVRLGARPLFADIDPLTYNLNPYKVKQLLMRNDLSARPKVIIPVHLFGQSINILPFLSLAREYNLMIVEDSSQSIGATYRNIEGKIVSLGTLSDIGCFSFFPSKNLGGAGDGGLIICMNDELSAKLQSMRNHGSHPNEKYRHIYVGGNFRLDTVQAAVIAVKLKHLPAWNKARCTNAAIYDQLFTTSGLVASGKIVLPHRAWPQTPSSHVFNQYVIRVQKRNQLITALKQAKIGHAIYYPTPIHLLECFAEFGGKPGDLPIAEKAAQEVLALPIYPELNIAQKKRIVKIITDVYKC